MLRRQPTPAGAGAAAASLCARKLCSPALALPSPPIALLGKACGEKAAATPAKAALEEGSAGNLLEAAQAGGRDLAAAEFQPCAGVPL